MNRTTSPMRALTLKAPWATAIARCGKNIENRTWQPPSSVIGQRIAIHQGVGPNREAVAYFEETYGAYEYVRGAILCTAVVAGWVHEDGDHSDTITAAEARKYRRSEWFQGSYGWVLTSVRRIKWPPRINGKLGVWIVPPRIAARLK